MTLPDWCYEVPWLTVRQPWADLLMAGVKDPENRTWPPPSTLPQWGRCTECHNRVPPTSRLTPGSPLHRRLPPNEPAPCGPVAWTDGPFPFRLGIHSAAKKADYNYADLRALVVGTPDVEALVQAYHVKVPGVDRRGWLLGSVQVDGCHHADVCWPHEPDCEFCRATGVHQTDGPCSRWALPNHYHWTPLSDPEPLDRPAPWKGRQGLWRIDREVAA